MKGKKLEIDFKINRCFSHWSTIQLNKRSLASKAYALDEKLNFRESLKGVFAKNERGYWLNAIKKRF